jgi:peptidoglycan/LPS O-acetylase OafA/YrhL
VLQPYFLPILARQGKKELRRSCFWLTLFTLLPRIAYCYDTAGWGLLEGAMAPKAFANIAFFNIMRFSPFFAVMEVMLGFVACRLVMLDGAEEGETVPKVGAMDTLLPLAGMIAVIALRGTGVLALSDMLVRSCIFMPLFLNFLMGLHRASIVPKVTDPIAKVLALKPLIWLGGLSFPIFVVHGPLGQLFYKKAIATKLFGGPMNVVYGPWFFWVYLLIVGIMAWFLQNFFMTSPKVGNLSKNIQAKLLKYL